MLGPRYRYRLINSQSQTITATVQERRFKRDSTGQEVTDTLATPFSAVAVSGSGGSQVSAAFDNTATGTFWDGAYIVVSAAASFATTGIGALTVWLERSLDGGTTWATAGSGTRLGSRTITAAESTTTIVFEVIAE